MQLLKIGGHEIGQSQFLQRLAKTVKDLHEAVVIVHGGGPAIAELQASLGLPTVKVDGLRVTGAESLKVTQMVLSGHVNKSIVAALISEGVQAAGLSGVDGGLLRCIQKPHSQVDLGYVGQIVEVQPGLLQLLMEQGIVPVVSPISLGLEGQIYNVNADEAAGAIAKALKARVLSFVSNVPGVLDQHQQPLSKLTAAQTEELIREGIIRDGMIPKVRAALSVARQSGTSVRIVNLAGLSNGQGTEFSY